MLSHVYLTGSLHRFSQLQQLAIRLNIPLQQPSSATKATGIMWAGQSNPRTLPGRLQSQGLLLSLLERKKRGKKTPQLGTLYKEDRSLPVQCVMFSLIIFPFSILSHFISPPSSTDLGRHHTLLIPNNNARAQHRRKLSSQRSKMHAATRFQCFSHQHVLQPY